MISPGISINNELQEASTNREVAQNIVEIKRTDPALKGTEKQLQAILDAKPESVKVIDEYGTFDGTKDELEFKVLERTKELSHVNAQLELDLLQHQRTQRQLQDQVKLLDLAHDAIIAVDLNNVITFWNHGAEEIYGWTKLEALGQQLNILLESQFPKPLPEINADLFGEGIWEGEVIQTKRDGTQIVVSSRWAVERAISGTPIAILKINRDITEYKRTEAALKESEAGFRTMADSAPVLLWMSGTDGLCTFIFLIMLLRLRVLT